MVYSWGREGVRCIVLEWGRSWASPALLGTAALQGGHLLGGPLLRHGYECMTHGDNGARWTMVQRCMR